MPCGVVPNTAPQGGGVEELDASECMRLLVKRPPAAHYQPAVLILQTWRPPHIGSGIRVALGGSKQPLDPRPRAEPHPFETAAGTPPLPRYWSARATTQCWRDYNLAELRVTANKIFERLTTERDLVRASSRSEAAAPHRPR